MNNYYKMFTQCAGKLKCPIESINVDEHDEYKITRLINDKFYGWKIQSMFSDYYNIYMEYISGKISHEEYLLLNETSDT